MVKETQDIALRYCLQQNSLTPADKGGNVQIVPTDNATILTLFKAGKIDGAWVPEPWATRLVVEGKGKTFLDERTLWPDGKFVTTNVAVRSPGEYSGELLAPANLPARRGAARRPYPRRGQHPLVAGSEYRWHVQISR